MIALPPRAAALALGVLLTACAPTFAGGQQSAMPPLPSAAPASEPAPIPPGKAPPAGAYAPGWDAIRYDVELALPEGPGWIAGRAHLAVARVEPVDTILRLDLVGLLAESVTVDGRGVPVVQRDGKLIVPTGPGRAGDAVQVDVVYSGVPDDGLILGRTQGGTASAFVDNWPDRARFWFPSIDHPSDKALVAFTVHAPAAWSVVANGTLVAGYPIETPAGAGGMSGARRTWRWRNNVPIPTYTMVVGATAFAVDTLGVAACSRSAATARADRCTQLSTWLYPSDREKGAASFARAPRMVDLFSEWIGPFPYEKLAHVQSSTRFGGMENVSAIFYDQRAVASGQNIEDVVAHETAHQWFGDSVTEADWHHLWLSEGFATYFAALFYEWADGEDAFRREMEQARLGYVRSPDTGTSILDPNASDLFGLLNHNNYEKGAWVLHTLRGVVGDSAFHAGIRAYYAAHANGTALSDDLRAAMERASGRDLGWFFDQWLTRPGYPVLRVAQRWIESTREVEVEVTQVQPESWPRFRLPTEILVRGAWGERRRAVELTGARTTVRIATPGPADAAVVDPDARMLKAMEGEPGAPAGR